MNRKPETNILETVLDEDVLQSLMAMSLAVELPSDVNARLRQKVLAIATAEGEPLELLTVRAGEGEWVSIAPLVTIKVLSDDATYKTVLYRFAPGGELAAHAHRGDEECIVLDGEVQIGELHVKRGDYHLARRGSTHGTLFSPTGCLLFVRHSRGARTASP